MKSRIRIALLATMAACLILINPGRATAAPAVVSEGTIPYPVYVQTSDGLPLAGVSLIDQADGSVTAVTDGGGIATYEAPYQCFDTGACVISYAALYGSRSDGSGDPCNTAPDGWPAGRVTWQTGTTPGALGSYTTGGVITLSPLPGSPFQPALSSEESGLLGVINQARATGGMAPLTISEPLTASADKYLGSVPARKLDYGQDAIYCENSGPGIRAADAGFPTSDGIGESVLQGDPDAETAFADLQNDPQQDSIADPDATLVGIAQEGNTWVIDTSDLQTTAPYYERAGDTGDVGDAALIADEFPSSSAAGEGSPPTPASSSGRTPVPTKLPRSPHLEISQASAKGRAIRVVVALSPEARGTVKVKAIAVGRRSKKDGVVLRVARRGGRATASGHLHPGRWILRIRFVPKDGTNWKPVTVIRKISVRH
jgi:uncharacterized protein YkwD